MPRVDSYNHINIIWTALSFCIWLSYSTRRIWDVLLLLILRGHFFSEVLRLKITDMITMFKNCEFNMLANILKRRLLEHDLHFTVKKTRRRSLYSSTDPCLGTPSDLLFNWTVLNFPASRREAFKRARVWYRVPAAQCWGGERPSAAHAGRETFTSPFPLFWEGQVQRSGMRIEWDDKAER